jgi:hypothetical protein
MAEGRSIMNNIEKRRDVGDEMERKESMEGRKVQRGKSYLV